MSVRLPAAVAHVAAERAARCRLNVSQWLGQVLEAILAQERCHHGEVRAEPPGAPAAAEDPSDDE